MVLIFLLSRPIFSQSCKSFTIKKPINSCSSASCNFVFKLTTKYGKTYFWDINRDSVSYIDTTKCGFSIKFITDAPTINGNDPISLNPPNGGPEDIVLLGNLTETIRGSNGDIGALNQFVCGVYSGVKQGWRVYRELPFLSLQRRHKLKDTVYYTNPVRVIEPLVIGVGANLRDADKLGASAKYLMSDQSTLEISFLLELREGCSKKCPDDTPPVFTNCPKNIEKVSTSEKDCVTVNWQEPTATDESGVPSVSSNYKSGFCFPIGTTKVIYTAKDVANNSSTCSFDVVVKPKPKSISPDSCVLYKIRDVVPCVGCPPFTVKLKNKATGDSSFLKINNGNVSFSPCGDSIFINAKDTLKNSNTRILSEDIVLSGGLTETIRPSGFNTLKFYKINFDSIRLIQFISRNNESFRDTIFLTNTRDTSTLKIGNFKNLVKEDEFGGSGTFILKDKQGVEYEMDLVFFLDSIGKPNCDRCTDQPKICPTLNKNIGDVCEDGNANTINDKVQTDCTCKGTPKHKDCPSLNKNIGDTCDDGNARTINDKVQSDCKCKGTPISTSISLTCPKDTTVTIPYYLSGINIKWKKPTASTTCTPGHSDNDKVKLEQIAGRWSGAFFTPGIYKVTYQAKDKCSNTATCSFNITVKKSAIPNLCTEYDVNNTYQKCNPQDYKPFAFKIGNNLYKADYAIFRKNEDGTATLKGIFRDNNWRKAVVNMRFKDFSIAATPDKSGCLNANSPTTNWYYYKDWSGTIQIGNNTPLSITGTSPLQIGNGANTQDILHLGASGKFTTNNNQIGQFAFKLSYPCLCKDKYDLAGSAIFTTQGKALLNKIRLDWAENTAEVGEVFEIEKLKDNTFEKIGLVKSTEGVGLRPYSFEDNDADEGINTYRINLLKNDGSIKQSPIIEVNMVKTVYAAIFPNPTDSYIDIQLTDPTNKEVTVVMTNILGHKLKEVTSNTSKLIHLEIGDVPNGIYSVRIMQKGKRDFVKQIVVQH
jgi:hypothetical protein